MNIHGEDEDAANVDNAVGEGIDDEPLLVVPVLVEDVLFAAEQLEVFVEQLVDWQHLDDFALQISVFLPILFLSPWLLL